MKNEIINIIFKHLKQNTPKHYHITDYIGGIKIKATNHKTNRTCKIVFGLTPTIIHITKTETIAIGDLYSCNTLTDTIDLENPNSFDQITQIIENHLQ